MYDAQKVGITATGEPDNNELYPNDQLPPGMKPEETRLLGAFAVVPAEYDHCVCSSGFSLCVGPAIPDLILEYALEFIKSSAGLRQMERRMTGGLYPAITQDQLEQVLLPVPSLQIQRMIIEHISKLREEIAKINTESKIRLESANADVESMILGTKKVEIP